MDIKKFTLEKPSADCQIALSDFLEKYMDPAFSALPKKEIDLLVMKILEDVGYISKDPTLYELVKKLKVTRAKARSLVYELNLRRLGDEELHQRVKAILKKPLLMKDGDQYLLEIENPFIADYVRSKLRDLGHATDSSFSGSLYRLSLGALTSLIASYRVELTKEEQKKIEDALIKAGAPDKSFRGLIKATLKSLASKYAKESGEALVEKVDEYLSPIFDGAIESVIENFEELIKKDEREIPEA